VGDAWHDHGHHRIGELFRSFKKSLRPKPYFSLMTIALILVAFVGLTQPQTQGVEGRWEGVAEQRPDSGFPVTVQLKISRQGESLKVAVSLPESRLIDLALPSPFSDSSTAVYRDGHMRLEFTPDIGL